MLHQTQIAFAIQNLALPLDLLFLLLVELPLSLEHFALSGSKLLALVAVLLAGLLLPL